MTEFQWTKMLEVTQISHACLTACWITCQDRHNRGQNLRWWGMLSGSVVFNNSKEVTNYRRGAEVADSAFWHVLQWDRFLSKALGQIIQKLQQKKASNSSDTWNKESSEKGTAELQVTICYGKAVMKKTKRLRCNQAQFRKEKKWVGNWQ